MHPGTMAALNVGQAAVVLSVEGAGSMTVRLLEMGFVPGTRVELIKRAPLGDPLEFQVRGYHVSLRAVEAARVKVTEA